MTAKEKAVQLVLKYSPKLPFYTEKDNKQKSKECALICVDEIIKTIQPHLSTSWWQEVKEEINKL